MFISDYFNPRTRVGCDDCMYALAHEGRNFNPRTRVGCDLALPLLQPRRRNFNPRTRVGCDSSRLTTYRLEQLISIHAPGWGATMITDLAFYS